MNLSQVGETGLIQRFRRILGEGPGVIRGIGDDAAVLPYTQKEYLLFATDAVREGVHFILKKGPFYTSPATPYQIGWKALGINLSDIAAMGGIPRYAVVSLGATQNHPVSFYEGIMKGMKAMAKKFNVSVVGGDTDRTEKLSITVAILGTVEKKRCVFRSGAKPGDLIFVTGKLGGSRKGRHLTFTPRVKEARILTKYFRLSAMIDISDGLAGDLAQICRESRVGAVIGGKAVPLSKGATLESALNDGEDFELLFTLPPREAGRLIMKRIRFEFPTTPIGRIVPKKEGIHIYIGNKKSPLTGGFRHF